MYLAECVESCGCGNSFCDVKVGDQVMIVAESKGLVEIKDKPIQYRASLFKRVQPKKALVYAGIATDAV